MIGLAELLKARALNLDAEQRRERVFGTRVALPFNGKRPGMRRSPDAHQALRLLHYWWPVVMGGSTVMVVYRATGNPVNGVGLALLLCGILAAYSLDRVLDSAEVAQTGWLRSVLQIGAAIGVVASACLLALMPLRTGMLVPVLGALVLAYPRLKSLPLLKTVLVSAAWTWSLIALPFQDASWLGWRAWTAPVAIPLTLIIASGCLLCDLKDVQADREASVPSLPVLMGRHGTVASAMVLATVGAVVALVEQRFGLLVGGLGLGLAAMRSNLLARDAVGPLLVDMILTIPGLLIALHVI
jgi:hypothetical protein